MEEFVESIESPEMGEESIKTTDQNLEDLQDMISELSVKMEDDRRASKELEVTIRSQRKRISTLKREQHLLKAMNESINEDIQEMRKDRSKVSCFSSGSQVAKLMKLERAYSLKRQQAIQEQVEEYRLALYSCCQNVHERQMDIKHLEGTIEEFHTIIQELRTKNQDLEVQLEKAVMFGAPHVDQPISNEEELGTVPHSFVEFSDVEGEQIAQEREEEKEQEHSLNVDVQTKSWWCQQAESLWKVVKRMGTFCLGVMRCQGLRSCMRQVMRSNKVHPACDDMLPV